MDAAHHGREVAHLARAVAGARPVGRAAVPRHADDADVDVGRVAEQRQAHEGRHIAEARHHRAGDRLRERRLGGVVHVVHFLSPRTERSRGSSGRGPHIGSHCGCKRAFLAVTNSSTAATKRSPSLSPIMMLSATKPRRAIQMPAAIMSKKNSSLASWLPAAMSAALRIGRVVAWAVIIEPMPENWKATFSRRQIAFRRWRIFSPRSFSALAAAGV